MASSVRSSRPAPQSTSTAAATSAAASTRRNCPPRPVAVRPSDVIACSSDTPVACHAGASPNSTPTRQVIATQKATTRPSMPSSMTLGSSSAGRSDGAAARIAAARAMPSTPPAAASTRLSVSNCVTIRRRPAPSAARTASSRVRTVARASTRLATFAQHRSSTKPTTPRNRIDVSRRSRPISNSRIGVIVRRRGDRAPVRAASVSASPVRSARAASIDTPGFSRPTTCSNRQTPHCPRAAPSAP